MNAPFNKLALGVKFRYIHPHVEKTWVKIGHNEIAEWDESQAVTNWVGQQICSFAENDLEASLSVEVEVILDEQKLEWCRKQLAAERKSNEAARREASRAYRASQDYVPYADDEYR